MADNHTPFDNDLLHDPQAPRNTQPLLNNANAANANAANANAANANAANANVPTAQPPIVQPPIAQPPMSRPLPLPSVVQAPLIPTPPVAPSRPLPAQVVSGNLADDDDTFVAPRGAKTSRLPTATLIGLAMAGGALGVTLLSGLIYRTIPRPAVKGLATSTTIATPRPAIAPRSATASRQIQMPDDASGADQSGDDSKSNAPTKKRSVSGTSPRVIVRPRTDDAFEATNARDDASSDDFQGADSGESETRTVVAPHTSDSRSSDSRSSDSRSSDSRSSDSRSSDSRSDIARQGDSRSASQTRAGQNNATENDASERGTDSGAQNSGTSMPRGASTLSRTITPSRNGYSITPPSGFRLVQKGRRTIWQGPGGAQILVETAAVGARSPRRDWERLDAALAKKYGARYRSRGISDTNLAGRRAAAWEFELDGPHGTTRKLDIAVHHNGRGYAVLGSAPAQNFDSVRPQLEAAINSFQIREESASNASPRRDTTSKAATQSDTARGQSGDEHYAPGDPARSDGGY